VKISVPQLPNYESAQSIEPPSNFFQANGWIPSGPVLEPDVAVVISGIDGVEDCGVVDFTHGQFMATWIACRMEVPDPVDVLSDIVNEVSFTDLLVINIEHDFDVRRIDLLDDIECLIASNEIVAWVINLFIEGLDDECHLGGFQEWCGGD